ncbi:protein SRC2 homolog [Quercus suber]|uniref:protein SRC2 homolog n=1 Tax=Quercus suber TaxID=58331 RepID=UPI000CE1EFA8|nr:protein SRC2 homolog [Quercus suber]
MAWRRLEIFIERANDLESVHLFQRLKAYHVVCICDDDGNRYYDEENKSPVDLNGRSNPNGLIDIVEAQQKRLYLVVRLESHRNVSCLGGKFIGQVRVRLEELLNDFGDADDKKLVTRSVINKNGEAQGRLTFSYKFRRTLDHPPAAPPPQPDNGNPVAQIPQRRNSNGHPIVRGAVEGVTTGLVTTLADILLNDN